MHTISERLIGIATLTVMLAVAMMVASCVMALIHLIAVLCKIHTKYKWLEDLHTQAENVISAAGAVLIFSILAAGLAAVFGTNGL